MKIIRNNNEMDKADQLNSGQIGLAENIRKACIEAAREGFRDASMSGLCTEGAMEAAVGAIQSLDLKYIIKNSEQI